MNREIALNSLYTQFDQSANQFCEHTHGIFCEISSEYKGEEKPQNLKYRFARIYYHSFVAEFKYTAHGSMGTVNSVLECLIYLDKSLIDPPILLPFLVDVCDLDTVSPLFVPLISNAEGMRQAFDCIGNVLHSMLDEITAISLDVDRKTNILQSFINELFLIFDVTPTHTPAGSYGLPEDFFTHVSYFYTYFTLRYTSAAFLNWIKGNRPLAIKQLSKTKKMTGYERRLLRLWNTEAAIELPDLSAIHKNAGSYNKIGVEKTSFKEFSTLLLSWIPLSIGTSLIYGAFYFSLMLIESRASVYLMGPENNLPFCICCGFITALGISYFTRFHFYRRLHKKDYERYCEMNYIQNGGGEDKLMKGFLCVLFAIGVCGCILFSRWNINFLSDGFIDNTSFFSLRGEYHSYSEVERVYYKPDRINGLGETIEYPSYVLVLTDGNEIDFYEYDGIENYEDDLLAFLREKGIPIDP